MANRLRSGKQKQAVHNNVSHQYEVLYCSTNHMICSLKSSTRVQHDFRDVRLEIFVNCGPNV